MYWEYKIFNYGNMPLKIDMQQIQISFQYNKLVKLFKFFTILFI